MIELEAEIVVKLGFNFGVPTPLPSLERFLRLLDYHRCTDTINIAKEILKLQINEPAFLAYRPSQIAACVCIIAINLNRRDED